VLTVSPPPEICIKRPLVPADYDIQENSGPVSSQLRTCPFPLCITLTNQSPDKLEARMFLGSCALRNGAIIPFGTSKRHVSGERAITGSEYDQGPLPHQGAQAARFISAV